MKTINLPPGWTVRAQYTDEKFGFAGSRVRGWVLEDPDGNAYHVATLARAQEKADRLAEYRGWTIQPEGRFSVWATSPTGHRGLFDPRDLLAEIKGVDRPDRYCDKCKTRKRGDYCLTHQVATRLDKAGETT